MTFRTRRAIQLSKNCWGSAKRGPLRAVRFSFEQTGFAVAFGLLGVVVPTQPLQVVATRGSAVRDRIFVVPLQVVAAVFAGGPVALPYSKFSPEVKEAAHHEYLESIEPYRNAAGYDIPGEFVFMLARKA